MKLAVIVPAAGSSSRFGGGQDLLGSARSKLDEDLGGKPVLQRAIELFSNVDAVACVIVAGPAEPAAMEHFKSRHADRLNFLGAKLVPGGTSHRWRSEEQTSELQ